MKLHKPCLPSEIPSNTSRYMYLLTNLSTAKKLQKDPTEFEKQDYVPNGKILIRKDIRSDELTIHADNNEYHPLKDFTWTNPATFSEIRYLAEFGRGKDKKKRRRKILRTAGGIALGIGAGAGIGLGIAALTKRKPKRLGGTVANAAEEIAGDTRVSDIPLKIPSGTKGRTTPSAPPKSNGVGSTKIRDFEAGTAEEFEAKQRKIAAKKGHQERKGARRFLLEKYLNEIGVVDPNEPASPNRLARLNRGLKERYTAAMSQFYGIRRSKSANITDPNELQAYRRRTSYDAPSRSMKGNKIAGRKMDGRLKETKAARQGRGLIPFLPRRKDRKDNVGFSYYA